METIDPQMTLTAVVVLTLAVALIWFDHLRKQRQPQPIKLVKTRAPQRSGFFEASPLDFAPAKKLAIERPLQPLVAVPTSGLRAHSPVERETVTIQMASSSPTPPFGSAEAPAHPLPPITIDAALWERLISRMPTQPLLSPSSASASQPGGMIRQPAFDELLVSTKPFTGLVLSIGINDSDSSMWHSHSPMQSVGNYIASLLQENDFSCRTAYDEFVMVCPGEQGKQSQHRLNHIAERLWDYQLRGIGVCSILFSWGGVQVQDRPLAEAVASATERMREIKRNGPSAKSAQAQSKAV